MLQVLSAEWCSACKAVKKFLAANNIEFQERNIDSDPEAYQLLNKLQLRSIPVVYLDDNNYVVGVDTKKILELSKK